MQRRLKSIENQQRQKKLIETKLNYDEITEKRKQSLQNKLNQINDRVNITNLYNFIII